MRFTSIHIENFKGLKNVTVPLSQFGCLIGENNSGKSTVLQALLLVLGASTRKPTEADFYDPSRPIRIELQIDDIEETDLARISNDAHRSSFAADVVEGTVRLVRKLEAETGGRSQLLVVRRGPRNENWTSEVVDATMRNRSGAELRSAIVGLIPELDPLLQARPTQKAIREAVEQLISALDADQLTDRDEPLATGLDAGIKSFLPEPIYIEAVKDVADDVKTTESATFGKLLGLLLEEVREQFTDVEAQFKGIQRKLSRVLGDDGVMVDERISQVQAIEALINGFVRESFPEVDLTISVPVPEMKAILSSARIFANDGHDGPVVSKGDGLKRAVAFAILRAYTNLRGTGIETAEASTPKGHYWLLFEEPELYLYPRAQKQLFKALELFAEDHPVLVTTHSPLFFDAESTRSFIKLRKIRLDPSRAPETEVYPIVIDAEPVKSNFQIICHENNSIGFFARKVVLVEGDSDVILFQHLAKLLEPGWDAVEQNISFARTNGKGNIANYRSFFRNFDIPVHVICDLDTLLAGFEKLDPDVDATKKRAALLQALDKQVAAIVPPEISSKEAKALTDSGDARALWRVVESARQSFESDPTTFPALDDAVQSFFAFKRKSERLELLAQAEGELLSKKSELLDSLRAAHTHVLARGSVEAYYGSASGSRDKVKQAIDYRETCTSLEEFRANLGESSAAVEHELRTIMGAIFSEV